jgi:glutathione S-transferase
VHNRACEERRLRDKQDPSLARIAIDLCKKSLARLEDYYNERFRQATLSNVITVANCILFSLLQFAKLLYGIDLTMAFPNLKRFYEWFETRDSAQPEGLLCDESLKNIASHWLQERRSILGWIAEYLKIIRLYLSFLGTLFIRFLRRQ